MRYTPAILLIVLAACRPAAPVLIPTPTTAALTGSVEIESPPEGAVIYSEVLSISGSAADLPDNTFVIALVGPDAQNITFWTIRDASGAWSIDLLHGYHGEPQEMTLVARPANPASSGNYAARVIGLAGLNYRPEGSFGRITFPRADSTNGGESLLVTGSVSGLPENALTVDLIDSQGQRIARSGTDAHDPTLLDEVPWTADLLTHDYFGPATIQLGILDATGSVTPLDSVAITIDTAAG